MITILDPRLWLAFLLSVGLAFGAGDWHAHRVDAKAYALKEARADAAVAKADVEAQATVAAGKKEAEDRLAAIVAKHQKENDDAKVKIDSLRNDVRSGAVRLSIATRAARPNTSTGDSTAAGDDQETRSELLPAAADALVAIATDADGSVRVLNTCIDAYNSARDEMKKIADKLR